MAKPLSPKGKLIRDAITANPGLSHGSIAELLTTDPERKKDGIIVTPADVYGQKAAMLKLGTPAEEPATPEPKPVKQAAKPVEPNGTPGLTAEDLRQLIALAKKAGGTGNLAEVLEVLSGI